jgi:DNA-directed RNA polymerase subunit RPC12/RpoP
MLFILGSRVYSDLIATVAYVCENCGQHAAHHLLRRTRKITLFFLPLLPVSTKYLDTCSYCGRTIRVSRQQAESALNQPAWGR